MFCRFCGRKIEKDSLFCAYCGRQLSTGDAETQPQGPPQNTVLQNEPPHSTAKAAPLCETVEAAANAPSKQHSSQRGRWIALASLIFLLAVGIIVLFATKFLCLHQWQDATCTQPVTCSRCNDTTGEALGHKLINATCTDPITCRVCKETFGHARGHSFREATCTHGKTCFNCGKVFGQALGHTWIEETFDTPKTCAVCNAVRPMTQPASGTVYIDAKKYYGSRLKVCAGKDYNTYVKLKDEQGNDVISFYVRAGETADVRVPTGKYYLYFAHGYKWYGPDRAFGFDTVYEKDDEILDFYNYTWTYTMDAGEDGNTETTIISKSEF